MTSEPWIETGSCSLGLEVVLRRFVKKPVKRLRKPFILGQGKDRGTVFFEEQFLMCDLGRSNVGYGKMGNGAQFWRPSFPSVLFI